MDADYRMTIEPGRRERRPARRLSAGVRRANKAARYAARNKNQQPCSKIRLASEFVKPLKTRSHVGQMHFATVMSPQHK